MYSHNTTAHKLEITAEVTEYWRAVNPLSDFDEISCH